MLCLVSYFDLPCPTHDWFAGLQKGSCCSCDVSSLYLYCLCVQAILFSFILFTFHCSLQNYSLLLKIIINLAIYEWPHIRYNKCCIKSKAFSSYPHVVWLFLEMLGKHLLTKIWLMTRPKKCFPQAWFREPSNLFGWLIRVWIKCYAQELDGSKAALSRKRIFQPGWWLMEAPFLEVSARLGDSSIWTLPLLSNYLLLFWLGKGLCKPCNSLSFLSLVNFVSFLSLVSFLLTEGNVSIYRK